MNLHTAKIFLVQHRQDYNRDRLAWLPSRLYRTWREAIPKVQVARKKPELFLNR